MQPRRRPARSACGGLAESVSGPVPPIAAAVAMMMKIDTTSPRIAPLTVSIRSPCRSQG